MRKVIFFLVVILMISILVLTRLYRRSLNENQRLKANQDVLFSQAEYYRTKDSLSIADVKRLVLTNREFARYCDELKRTVKKLDLKIKDLQSVSRTATESNYSVRVVIKDSILSEKKDTLRCIDFQNPFLTLVGCMKKQEFYGQIITRDTLIQVVYRVPRKFLFIRWGTKAIRQKVLSCNPYNQIVYDEYLEFKK